MPPTLNVRLIYGGRSLVKVQATSETEFRHEAEGLCEHDQVCAVLMQSLVRLEERYALSISVCHCGHERMVAALRTELPPDGDSVFFRIPPFPEPLRVGDKIEIIIRVRSREKVMGTLAATVNEQSMTARALSTNSRDLSTFCENSTTKFFHFFESFATSTGGDKGRTHTFTEAAMEQMLPKYFEKVRDNWSQFASKPR